MDEFSRVAREVLGDKKYDEIRRSIFTPSAWKALLTEKLFKKLNLLPPYQADTRAWCLDDVESHDITYNELCQAVILAAARPEFDVWKKSLEKQRREYRDVCKDAVMQARHSVLDHERIRFEEQRNHTIRILSSLLAQNDEDPLEKRCVERIDELAATLVQCKESIQKIRDDPRVKVTFRARPVSASERIKRHKAAFLERVDELFAD